MKSFPDAFLPTSREIDCPYCGQSSRFDFQYYHRIYQYNTEAGDDLFPGNWTIAKLNRKFSVVWGDFLNPWKSFPGGFF